MTLTPDTPERHDRHLSTLSNNGTQSDDTGQPWPTLTAEYLLVIAGSGGGLITREYASEEEALRVARGLHNPWRLMSRMVTPWQRLGPVRQTIVTEVDGPDPADRLPEGGE